MSQNIGVENNKISTTVVGGPFFGNERIAICGCVYEINAFTLTLNTNCGSGSRRFSVGEAGVIASGGCGTLIQGPPQPSFTLSSGISVRMQSFGSVNPVTGPAPGQPPSCPFTVAVSLTLSFVGGAGYFGDAQIAANIGLHPSTGVYLFCPAYDTAYAVGYHNFPVLFFASCPSGAAMSGTATIAFHATP